MLQLPPPHARDAAGAPQLDLLLLDEHADVLRRAARNHGVELQRGLVREVLLELSLDRLVLEPVCISFALLRALLALLGRLVLSLVVQELRKPASVSVASLLAALPWLGSPCAGCARPLPRPLGRQRLARSLAIGPSGGAAAAAMLALAEAFAAALALFAGILAKA